MRALSRLYLAAYLTDCALYTLLTALPWKILALGASSVVLGAIPACSLAFYVLSAAAMGRRSDRIASRGRRLRQARIGLLVFAGAAMLLAAAPTLALTALAVAPVGLGLGFFWPAAQATLADLTPGRTGRALGRFNVCWSLGKATGYFGAGILVQRLGPEAVILVAAGLGLAVALLLPARHAASGGQRSAVDGAGAPPGSARRAAFRRVGWLLNTATFGIGATLSSLYPKWLQAHGHGEVRYGLVLATVMTAQALAFVVYGRSRGWAWRRAPIFPVLAGASLAAASLGRLEALPAVLLAAVLIGGGVGSAYQASLHYSVHGPARRGRYAGIHEASQAAGALSIPIMAGALADWSGDLGAPYVLAGGLLAVGLVVGGWMLRPRGALAG